MFNVYNNNSVLLLFVNSINIIIIIICVDIFLIHSLHS